jgi:tight adherence protein C
MMLPFLAFVFGTALVGGAALLLMPRRTAAIDRRLEELTVGRDEAEPPRPRFRLLIGLSRRIGEKMPRSPKEMGTLRLRLVQAGFRRDEALTIFFGIRVLFAVAFFLVLSSPILIRPNTLMALGGLALGYVLPGMILARLAKRRAHRIRLSLADALDLLVVSVEAGLGLDQALTRVGTELAFAHPELASELKLINLELRAGKARAEALRNLADRTGVDDLSSLVHFSLDLDHHHRTGRDQVHDRAVPDGPEHEALNRGAGCGMRDADCEP